jgi:hypothetical protein
MVLVEPFSARFKIFLAELISLSNSSSQDQHLNTLWLRINFSFAISPQPEQVWDVFLGFTRTNCRVAISAASAIDWNKIPQRAWDIDLDKVLFLTMLLIFKFSIAILS